MQTVTFGFKRAFRRRHATRSTAALRRKLKREAHRRSRRGRFSPATAWYVS